jgi:hypothetical protein
MKKAGLVFLILSLMGFAAIVISITARIFASQDSPPGEKPPRLDTDINVDTSDETVTPIPSYPGKLTVQALGMNSQPQWGLIENPSVPIPGRDFQPENAWKYDTGDGYILVLAGYSPSNDDQGIVFVDIDRQMGVITRSFTVPNVHGSVHIVKAVGARLVLETKGNKTLYFDVPGLRFVDSLDEVVPTTSVWGAEALPVLTGTMIPASP